jgi:uncharacterized repeat protein (TIGR02543 family)
MLRKFAGFLATIMVMNVTSLSSFAAPGDKYTVTFVDNGLAGQFTQGTACGENGRGYGTTENKDGNYYVTTTNLVESENISEGQYYLGSPNAISYSSLTKDEQAFLEAYKGYRYRKESESSTEDEIVYDYYAFRGWLVASTGTGQTRNGEIAKPGEQVVISADTTFTAQWGIDANRNGVADIDEGDFEVLYMPGRDSDGSSSWTLAEGSTPPSHKGTAEVETPVAPYYEITAYNDPENEEYNTGIEDFSGTYVPTIDETYAKENNLHKAFAGWEYDLTSPGQDASTITEAPSEEIDSEMFEVMAESLYNNYYSRREVLENADAIDEASADSTGEALDELLDKLDAQYRAMAAAELKTWISDKTTIYHLQPGTKGIIKTREWNNNEKHYSFLLPYYTTNTNIVLRAVWEEDLNDNDVPDEEESRYTVEYVNNEAGYTGTLPTDSGSYLPGERFNVAAPGGIVAGKIFMGWVDTYWDSQYKFSTDTTAQGYTAPYKNKYHFYVGADDFSWKEEFENRYSYKEEDTVYEVKGQAVVGDGTVPHNVEEDEVGQTFPAYDEEGYITGTTYLVNTVETGEKEGKITLTALWGEDKNNNSIPDMVEPQNSIRYKVIGNDIMLADEPVGTTDALNNIDPETDPELYEAYRSGEKKVVTEGWPADMTSFTGDWVTVPKDDAQLGTDYWVPRLSEETKADLKLIFKDWLYVSAGNVGGVLSSADLLSSNNTDGVIEDIKGGEQTPGGMLQATGTTPIDPVEIKSQITEIQPGQIFKLVEDVYMIAVWYNDINENDKPDETETKYTIKYTAGTGENVTNLPPDQTEVLCSIDQEVAEAVPYREGYSFTGWKCSLDGQIYKAGQVFEMPEDNVIFEATWAKTTYLLTYLNKDGDIITAYNYAKGQNIALLKLDDFTESGENEINYVYTFTGWQDLETGQVYSSSYAMPEKNVSLQAYYVRTEQAEGDDAPVYHRVTYSAGASDTVTDIPVDVTAYSPNSLVVVSYTVPVRAGFIFKGWSYNNQTYQPGGHFTIGESDVTLTAIWEEDKTNNQSQTESTTESTSESASESASESDSESASQSETESTSEATTESGGSGGTLPISTDNSVNVNDTSTYPDLEDTLALPSYLKLYVGNQDITKGSDISTVMTDPETGIATLPDDSIQLAMVIPDDYTGDQYDPGDVVEISKSAYDISYINNDGNSDVAYLVLTGKNGLDGVLMIPFSVKKTQQVTPDVTNVTGNAKNNITHTGLQTVVSFDNTYLDYAISTQGYFLVNAISNGSDGESIRVTDYIKYITSEGDIAPAQGTKFISLGMFVDAIVARLATNPSGITTEWTFREALVDGNNNMLALDVLPMLKKSYYDGLIGSDAYIEVAYNPDVYSKQYEYTVIGTLDLSKLDYNEVTIGGETYITPMWQTVACELTDSLIKGDEPTLSVTLKIPNYTGQPVDKNAFRLDIDNIRVGKTSAGGTDDPVQNYTFIQTGLDMTDPSTVPTDPTKAVEITGITVTPNPLGVQNTKEPNPVITNSTTGEQLVNGTDYELTTTYSDSANLGLVKIEGKGHYTGVAVLPFTYSEGGASSNINVTGTAKNNIYDDDLTIIEGFSKKLSSNVSSADLYILDDYRYSFTAEDEEDNCVNDLSAVKNFSFTTANALRDYGGKQDNSDNCTSMMAGPSSTTVTATKVPNGMSIALNLNVDLDPEKMELIAIDAIPYLKKDIYTSKIENATIKFAFAQDKTSDRILLDEVKFDELGYNEVTVNGVEYITPMWQTLEGELAEITGGKGILTVTLLVPDVASTDYDKDCFLLAVDNLRVKYYDDNDGESTESTTSKVTDASTESTTSSTTESTTSSKETSTETTTNNNGGGTSTSKTKIGVTGYTITYGNTSTYPKDIAETYSTYGMKLTPAKIGNVSNKRPSVTVKDESGRTLTSAKDYVVTYDWTGSNTTKSPYFLVVEGLGNYEGFIAIPFTYSTTASSTGSSGSSSGGGSASSKASGGGGGGTTTIKKYEVKFIFGEYGELSSEDKNYKESQITDDNIINITVKTTDKFNMPTVEAFEGYEFVGWSTNTTENKITTSRPSENTNYYAIYKDIETGKVIGNSYDNREVETATEETTEATTKSSETTTTKGSEDTTKDDGDVIKHESFISGYNDGTFKPNGTITRAETCSILAKALGLNTDYTTSSFNDIPTGAWYTGAVEAIKANGITSGYSDGTFKPQQNITRAEFVTLIAKAKGLSGNTCDFVDVQGTWAYNYICGVANKNWVGGYNDGTFRPNENITRTEAVVIINKMLGRTPDTDYIAGTYREQFSDVPTTFWGYPYIFEAASTHYVKSADYTDSHETWVGLD